jgi:thioredoxin reductase
MTTFIDQEVTKIQKEDQNIFRATTANGTIYTARKVILGSGLKDDLPDVPGLRDAFGKGVFWCPWCDGFEHRSQPMGVLGNLSDA